MREANNSCRPFNSCLSTGGVYYRGEYEDDYRDEGSSTNVMIYNPQTTRMPWFHCATMRKLRASPSVVVVDQKIYVLGGTSRTIT